MLYVDYFELRGADSAPLLNERIVFNGKNLYRFIGVAKQAAVYPVSPNALSNRGVFDWGPLPFLLGIHAANLRERYDITFAGEDGLGCTLRFATKLRADKREFSQAVITLDRDQLVPTSISLQTPDAFRKPTTFTCSISDIKENAANGPQWFDGDAMVEQIKKAKWKVVQNPIP